MARLYFNLLLLAALLAIIVVSWAIRRDPSQPNYDFMPEMTYSIPYDTFAPAPQSVFADGKTLQPPVRGAIARGAMPLHYEATPEDALRAGEELHNPYTLNDATALERGEQQYLAFCAQCHGDTGNGDGPVTLRGFPPPPSIFAENARNMKDGQFFHLITYGQENMSGLAAQLSREDRWKIILQLRALQQSVKPAPAQTSATTQTLTTQALTTQTLAVEKEL